MSAFEYKKNVSKRQPGRPKKEQSVSPADMDTEALILTKAKQLFRQKGFSSVSINDIVTTVGITKPTLYYYFSDKETLYTAVICDVLKHANIYIQQGLKDKGPVEEKLIRLATGFFKNAPTSVTLLIRDAMEHLSPENIERIQTAQEDYIIAPFDALLQEGIRNKELQEVDTHKMAQLLVSLMDTLVISCTLHQSRQFDFETMANMLIKSLFHGIAR